jgi:hypothetical protein
MNEQYCNKLVVHLLENIEISIKSLKLIDNTHLNLITIEQEITRLYKEIENVEQTKT